MKTQTETSTCMLSVIIPVYNCEAYLDRCIQSLIKQTLQNWVALFINDGSTDRSQEILEAYAAKDSRITVIQKKNGGAASARNKGIDAVKTKYFTMVDADDYIPETALQQLLDAAVSTNCDLVVAPVIVKCESGETKVQRFPICGYMEDYIRFLFRNVYRGPIAKLYRKDIVDCYHLRMPEDMVIGEDTVFVVSYWTRTKSIYVISEPLYTYDFQGNPNSLMHVFKQNRPPYETFKQKYNGYWRVFQFLLEVEPNKAEISKWSYEIYREFWNVGHNIINVYLNTPQEKNDYRQYLSHQEKAFAPYVSFIKRILTPHRYPTIVSALRKIKGKILR